FLHQPDGHGLAQSHATGLGETWQRPVRDSARESRQPAEPPGTRNSSSDSIGVFAATDSPTRRLHLVRFFDRVIANDHRLRGEHPDGVLYTGKHTQAGRETKPVRERVSSFRCAYVVDRWRPLPVQRMELSYSSTPGE